MTSKKLPFEDLVTINVEHMSVETKTKIQEKAFELGYGWKRGSEQEVKYTADSYKWYILDTDADLLYSILEVASRHRNPREITLRDLMETEVPTPVDDNEPIPGYPGWVVGAKLRQVRREDSFGTVKGEVYTITHVNPDSKGVRVDGQDPDSEDIIGMKYIFELVTEEETKTTGIFPENRFIDIQYMSQETKQSILDHLAALGYQKRSGVEPYKKYIEFLSESGAVSRLSSKGLIEDDAVETTLRELMERQPDPEPLLTEEEKIQQALPEELKGLQVGDLIRFTENLCGGDTPEGYVAEVTGLSLVETGPDVKVNYVDAVEDRFGVIASRGQFEKAGKPNRRIQVHVQGSEKLYDAITEHLVSLGYNKWGSYDGDTYLLADKAGDVFTTYLVIKNDILTIAQAFQLTKKDVYV